MSKDEARDRAGSDPVGLAAEWEAATQESIGRDTLGDAMAVVRGVTPPSEEAEDDPVVNGYKGGNRSTEIPIEQIRRSSITTPPRDS